MGNDDNPLGDLGDLDWGEALEEWEKNTFVPEVARDAETNTVAAPLANEESGAPPKPKAPAPPRPAAGAPAPPLPNRALQGSTGEGTVIAPVPSELANDPAPRPSQAPPSMQRPSTSGGLSQLFAKGKEPGAPGVLRPPTPMGGIPRPPRPASASSPDLGAPPPDEKTRVAPPSKSQRGSVTRQVASPIQEALAELDVTEERKSAALAESAGGIPVTEDVETVISDRAKMGSLSDAETQTRLPNEEPPTKEISRPKLESSPADDEMATLMRHSPSAPPQPSAVPSIPTTERERPPAPEGPTTFEEERPVSRWLDENTSAAFRQRALWLEEEARAAVDPVEQARGLLVVSELLALVGATEHALAIAVEARDRAPAIALAWRQARQLAPREAGQHDNDAVIAALDAEAASSPTAAARAHATLMAADFARVTGDGDAAVTRWMKAMKLEPSDVRAPAARAALALAQEDYTTAGALLADNSELAQLGSAVATALRLRGVERPGPEAAQVPINDGLRRARKALEAADAVGTQQALADVTAESSLTKGALWLSAAFGATHIAARRAAARSLKALAGEGESLARRQVAARGIELADPELVASALAGDDGTFEAAERAALLALSGGEGVAERIGAFEGDDELASLVDALAAVSATSDAEAAAERSQRVAGTEETRALARLGRLLSSKPEVTQIDVALAGIASPRPASAAGVALEAAIRGKRWNEVSDALSALPAGDEASTQRHIAAALVAERAGNKEDAKRAWSEALAQGAMHDSVVRAVANVDADVDVASWLGRVADSLPDGPAAAILRLEALARDAGTEEEQGASLEKIHRAAPTLGIAAFLAERIGRRKGDLDEVLRWIQERRAYATDPLETALDAVREALLVADRDAELASTRLEEAHRARPDDVALRELYERLATNPPEDRAAWREERANKLTGQPRALLYVEAALEHERAGDHTAALRVAKKALEAGDKGLARVLIERAEIEVGQTERQVEELIARSKETEVETIRRETYERLAELDAFGKKDRAAALAWHETILGELPKHLASLRYVEHELITAKRDEDLEGIADRIALALDRKGGGELTAHAQLAARLKARDGGWERTADMARLAATQEESSLWALRALNAHARIQKDDDAITKTTQALLERTQRPAERAALLLRLSEAAARKELIADARAFLEQAANEDSADVVTWGFLAEVRERAGETRAAAEACESLARTSVVPAHQLLAWFDAARIWLDEVKDPERGMSALEQAAEIDVTHSDVFQRLSALYAEKNLDGELARLLEKRLEKAEDANERVTLEVELARALAGMGELAKAKSALESALDERPSHTTALALMAEISSKEGDWDAAEQSYVRLARLVATPDEQRTIYEKLGEIYGVHLNNLSRAEVALKEVLKRAPKHIPTMEKLVDVYKRQTDTARAVEIQLEIVGEAKKPDERLERLVALSAIHEHAHDLRKAEQVLESARKEFPTSVAALRAMAEFYRRQHQMPAMQILLDRAAGDARRSFAAGRFVTSLFEVLHAAFELRGKKDAARVVGATLAAVEGTAPPGGELAGADARAVDPRLDDLLAPDLMSPALRALLYHAGDALDATAPVDLRALKAAPLTPGTKVGATVGAVATVVGLGALQILVSPQLGRVALPLSSNPPTLLVGDSLKDVASDRARQFIVVRAMKMILTRSNALLRGQPDDVAALVSALFTAFNPSFVPQGVDAKRVQELSRRLLPALPRNLDPTVGVIALEAAGNLGTAAKDLSAAVNAWANRCALLAVGDPAAALEAIAWLKGEDAVPKGAESRAAWVARTQEARELMTFSVSDAYTEARARLSLG